MMRTTVSKGHISGHTISEKASIVKHAKDIFIKICSNEPVTSPNLKGHKAKAKQAIELAEIFHEGLTEAGYENE